MDTKNVVGIESSELADQLQRSFYGNAWHGPAICEVLAGIDAPAAARRPVTGVHSIWEIVHHLTAWLDIADRRAAGEAPEVDPLRDWPPVPAPSAGAWKQSMAALETAHNQLHATVLACDDRRLGDTVDGSDPTLRGLVFGILQHNTYHAGQLALLVRAASASSASA